MWTCTMGGWVSGGRCGGGQSVEAIQGFRARVIEAGDDEHGSACDEGCEGGCK